MEKSELKQYQVLEILDITGANDVEIMIRDDGKVIWVNVDGICRLRICQIKKLHLIDNMHKT